MPSIATGDSHDAAFVHPTVPVFEAIQEAKMITFVSVTAIT
jgi:hypothetical protein